MDKDLNLALNKASQKIFAELYQMYQRKEIVNKPFYRLVRERIDEQYKDYETQIVIKVVELIPLELYLCPNDQYVFETKKEMKARSNKS